jgi:hypothetical protein
MAKGFDVQFKEFAGAFHGFDWRAVPAPNRIEGVQTARKCVIEEGDDGYLLNAKTSQPFSYQDPCVEYGVTTGYQERASLETRIAVKDLISAVFSRDL